MAGEALAILALFGGGFYYSGEVDITDEVNRCLSSLDARYLLEPCG
jgi:hypothetical protein